MLNSTYGAGYRAGLTEHRIQRPGGTRGIKITIDPECPFTALRFVSYTLWHAGFHAGMMRKITGQDQPLPLFQRIDWLTVAIVLGFFIFLKVI